MSFRIIALAASVGALLSVAGPARAADVDYIDVFRQKVLKCVHPTVNADKATVEITKGPDKAGETTTIRFKTFYDGLVRKNSMETEMMVRQAGSIRQMMIKTLADSGSGGGRCALEKSWADF